MSCPEDLQEALGYRFRDTKLCAAALSHSSVGGTEFQRLEYLGDAALSFAIARQLLERHPDWDEGRLTKVRAALVQNSYLAELAEAVGLMRHLRVSTHFGALHAGEGGQGVLADALEALLGAVVLDGGVEAMVAVVANLFDENDIDRIGHPKSELQEWMQAHGLTLPQYREISRTGADHAPFFEVECALQSPDERFIGRGWSLKRAESEAAGQALAFLQKRTGE